MRLGVGVGVEHIKSAPSSMLGCLIGQEEEWDSDSESPSARGDCATTCVTQGSHDLDLDTAIWPRTSGVSGVSGDPGSFIRIYGARCRLRSFGRIFAQPAASQSV